MRLTRVSWPKPLKARLHDQSLARRAFAAAIRADRDVSLSVCAADAWAIGPRGDDGDRLRDDGPNHLARHDQVLGSALRNQLRPWSRHRHHHGIRVRNELGLLLALRRRHFWRV